MSKKSTSTESEAVVTAVGLIWGWLEQCKAEEALTLVKACLVCWPQEAQLHLLHRQCLAVLNMPWPEDMPFAAQDIPEAWLPLIDKYEARRRMHMAASVAGTSGV